MPNTPGLGRPGKIGNAVHYLRALLVFAVTTTRIQNLPTDSCCGLYACLSVLMKPCARSRETSGGREPSWKNFVRNANRNVKRGRKSRLASSANSGASLSGSRTQHTHDSEKQDVASASRHVCFRYRDAN